MGTEKPVIRKAEAKDTSAFAQIESECFNDAWNHAMIEKEIFNNLAHYWVLECDQQVVAYAGFWLVKGEAQINRVAVATKFRNKGLGNYLVQTLVNNGWDLGADSITLEMRSDNEAAHKVYLRAGFKDAGIRPHYYEDGSDALIMWLYRDKKIS